MNITLTVDLKKSENFLKECVKVMWPEKPLSKDAKLVALEIAILRIKEYMEEIEYEPTAEQLHPQ